jgi:hypothetical protein
MIHFIDKRAAVVALTAGLLLGGSGVAFAYFTSTGSGSGSATIGTVGGRDFAITSSSPTGSIYPGAAPIGFTVQAQNTGSVDEHVDDVTVTVASDGSGYALDADGAPITGCLASWLAVGTPVVVGATLSPGAYSAGVASTIGLTEAGVNQDACQGANVKLIFATSNPV